MYDEERDWMARARESRMVDVVIDAAGSGVLETAHWCVKDGGIAVSIAISSEKALVEKEGKRGVLGQVFVAEPGRELLGKDR